MNPTQMALFNQYLPWIKILGVFALFFLLRFTRRGLRRRVDEIGYRLLGERGWMVWLWMNAPGVMLHELSHAFVMLLFYPFGFRITRISLFHIQLKSPPRGSGRAAKAGRQSLQLGEVQYSRPPGRFMTYVGDGFSGIAPLFGGILTFLLLYWVATGYTLWQNSDTHLQFLRPGWPWWTLIFAPYLILTVTSELWPSRQDWRGTRWLVGGMIALAVVTLALLWISKALILDDGLVLSLASIAFYIDFALLVLLALDVVFLLISELIVQALRR
ncbi:MAG TPA: hypothetical protein VNE38_09535 [Ktedonobacteraceae bacterium]|nr:hypothetical protein [Ktedonobacteraceae bacterium]